MPVDDVLSHLLEHATADGHLQLRR
jgi:hypothetical protein